MKTINSLLQNMTEEARQQLAIALNVTDYSSKKGKAKFEALLDALSDEVWESLDKDDSEWINWRDQYASENDLDLDIDGDEDEANRAADAYIASKIIEEKVGTLVK